MVWMKQNFSAYYVMLVSAAHLDGDIGVVFVTVADSSAVFHRVVSYHCLHMLCCQRLG